MRRLFSIVAGTHCHASVLCGSLSSRFLCRKILRSTSSVFLFSLPKCFLPDLYVVEKQKNNCFWFFKWPIFGKQSLCFSGNEKHEKQENTKNRKTRKRLREGNNPKADMLVAVLISLVLRGEEIKGFDTRYCGPSGVDLAHLSIIG